MCEITLIFRSCVLKYIEVSYLQMTSKALANTQMPSTVLQNINICSVYLAGPWVFIALSFQLFFHIDILLCQKVGKIASFPGFDFYNILLSFTNRCKA